MGHTSPRPAPFEYAYAATRESDSKVCTAVQMKLLISPWSVHGTKPVESSTQANSVIHMGLP